MKTTFQVSLIGAALMAVVLGVVTFSTNAATDKYKFAARGNVIAVDGVRHILTIAVTHATDKAATDLVSETTQFKATGAKIYKKAGTLEKRIKLTNVAIGDEIVFKGVAKNNGTYTMTWAQVQDRSFTIVGKLKEHDKALMTMKIAVTSSTYKPTSYNSKDVVVKYSSSTKFSSNGQDRNADEINAGNQKIKVVGKISGGDWEVTSVVDDYNGK